MDTEEVVTQSLASLAVNYLLYGAYLLLFSTCVYILVQRQRRYVVFYLVSMSILFLLATTQTILYTITDLHSLLIELGLRDDVSLRSILQSTIRGLFILSNAMGDMVLLHRCFVVWNHKPAVLVVPTIMAVINNALAIAAVISNATGKYTGSGDSASAAFGGYVMFAFFSLNIATNVLLTLLIAGRIWWLRREVVGYLGSAVNKRYLMTIHIIIESGLIYPLALILELILNSDTGIEFHTRFSILTQVVGIAPTSIIVRTGLGIAVENVNVIPSLELEAASNSNAPDSVISSMVPNSLRVDSFSVVRSIGDSGYVGSSTTATPATDSVNGTVDVRC
ncbi:hypothetical protein D9758_012129 [Tetrapyrgos nigripes]|uniref:Uncharacterized protein n=1 Tax=Tetrapyrgos nigripes TaxID=182062 RepID=A0A8H5CLY4_9AGAR|nr:hypothetical protein D9758_012129 [Tetrapyrgos nigripes]